MPNPHPIHHFNSDWPDRVRALNVNDTLFVPKKELTIKQVRNLVGNMNYRLKGKALYSTLTDRNSGDSIITCILKEGDVSAKRKRVALVTTKKTKAAPVVKGKRGRRKGVSRIMPKPMEAYAIIECTYVNGGAQTMRAADPNELDALLARCRDNTQVTEIITYKRAEHQRKQVAWESA